MTIDNFGWEMLDVVGYQMLDFDWNMSRYDHTGPGLENVGFSWVMLDFDWNILRYDHTWAGKCWI